MSNNEMWLSPEERKIHRMYLEDTERRLARVKNPILKKELRLHLRNLRSELIFDKENKRRLRSEEY